jgi:hypothetical protein
MIIDAHNHVMTWENIPDAYWNAIANYIATIYKERVNRDVTIDAVKQNNLEPLMDTDGSKLLRNMDRSGVDMAFIHAIDWGYGLGEANQPVDAINQFYGAIARQNPDRVVAFAGVDPRRPDAVEILDRAVNDYGCRGLKYHPTSGFYPDGEESCRVLEKACEFRIPLMSHLGPISRPFKSKYARPEFLDTVVSDFPELTVIGAHLGLCWWHELVNMMSAKRTTFYADFSGHQLRAKNNFPEFCRILRTAMDEAGSSRILWGTDNPMLEPVLPMKKWLQMIRDLPTNAPQGIEFTSAEIDNILGENAARIVKRIP